MNAPSDAASMSVSFGSFVLQPPCSDWHALRVQRAILEIPLYELDEGQDGGRRRRSRGMAAGSGAGVGLASLGVTTGMARPARPGHGGAVQRPCSVVSSHNFRGGLGSPQGCHVATEKIVEQ